MALSARELVLIIRAKDEATRSINAVGRSLGTLGSDATTAADKAAAAGAALLSAGTLLASAGAIGTGFFAGAANDAQDYSKLAALALTQAKDAGGTLEELKQIGIDIGNDVPVPLASLQEGLFDIFSTIDTNVPQATELLELFARAAVAGDAPITSVSKSVLAQLNAWQLPLSATENLLDLQFRTVEKGVGTYDQFAGAMGRAVPAAVAAGQSVDTLSGMMAFLTRQGLSAEMAATSSARALELLAKPDVTKALEDYGIKVKNANGEFLQMDEIVGQLANNKGWAQMSAPERKKLFDEIFGTGTIQARRFFDVAIPNYDNMNSLMGQVSDNSGAMERAYDIMFNQPQSQMDLLNNKYEAMKIAIGDQLLPAKMKLAEAAMRLIDAWNALDPGTREMIVKFAAIASVVMLVLGTIFAVVGGFLLFIGIVAPVVGGVGALLGIFGAIILAIVAVGIAVWQMIANWDAVQPVLQRVWEILQQVWNALINGAQAALNFVIPVLQAIWNAFKTFATVAAEVAGAVLDKLGELWGWLKDTFGPGLSEIWNTLTTEFGALVGEFGEFLSAWANNFKAAWDFIKGIWDQIAPYTDQVFSVLTTIITTAWNVIWTVIKTVGTTIIGTIKVVWDIVVATVVFAMKFISNVIQLALNVLRGDWSGAWNNIKNIARAAWEFIKRIVMIAVNVVKGQVGGLLSSIVAKFNAIKNAIVNTIRSAMNSMKSSVRTGVTNVMSTIRGIPGKIVSVFANAGSLLVSAGSRIIGGLISGITSRIGGVRSALGGITSRLTSWKGPPAKDRKILIGNGKLIMEGLQKGLTIGFSGVRDYLQSVSNPTDFSLPNVSLSPTPVNQSPRTPGQTDQNGMTVGLMVQGDLVLGSDRTEDDIAKLDYWSRKLMSGV